MRFLLLLLPLNSVAVLLYAQSTFRGDCATLGHAMPTPKQLDSLQHLDPVTEAGIAFKAGEHRLWSTVTGFGPSVPGTAAGMAWLDSLAALTDLSDSSLAHQAREGFDRHLRALDQLRDVPGLREMPNTGHTLIFCSERRPDGSVVTDSTDLLWKRSAAEYAATYNRAMLDLLHLGKP